MPYDLWWESTGDRRVPSQRTSNANLFCLLCCWLAQSVEQTENWWWFVMSLRHNGLSPGWNQAIIWTIAAFILKNNRNVDVFFLECTLFSNSAKTANRISADNWGTNETWEDAALWTCARNIRLPPWAVIIQLKGATAHANRFCLYAMNVDFFWHIVFSSLELCNLMLGTFYFRIKKITVSYWKKGKSDKNI